MPKIEFRPVSRVKKESAWLLDHRRDVTSQIGQDGILEAIFNMIGDRSRYCVEFGAWDGRWLSNTYNLIANRGWSGLLIEGDKDRSEEIKITHPYDRVAALNALVGWEGENSLDAILSQQGAPNSPALVSIDIDGNDWYVWEALEQHRPDVVLVEFNPTIPLDVYFVQDKDPSMNQGGSLLAMVELGKMKGYSLVCVNQWDAFFVTDELFPSLKIQDNSIDALYFYPDLQTRFFQGYDGTIYTTGNNMLVWKNISFDKDDVQIIPKSQRFMK
jgi:hypothetical protein